MKICIIGAGSTYTPELINGLLERIDRLPIQEVCLMDIDAKRLEIVGGFARRMVAARGEPFRVTFSMDQREAIRGADYVITQLRVGMMAARREDEYLGRRYGLIGQETTGIGGMAKALRTVPVILQIARDIRELAPQAVLINFTNPSGLVTQALSLYAGEVTAVGVCNSPYNAKMDLLHHLEKATGQTLDPRLADLDTLGLNHLSWHRGFRYAGEELWPKIFPTILAEARAQSQPGFSAETLEALGMLPNYYLSYYYATKQRVKDQEKWPPSRAEQVMELEKDLLREYADPRLTTPPADLMKRGGAYYSTVATQLIDAHFNDRGETHVVNVAHRGAVPGWPDEWVLELPCRVDRQGFHPLPNRPLPPVCFGLLAQVKSFELLTAEAAVNGDRRLAYQALLAHPLGPQADQVQTVLDDLLKTNRTYLPAFWK